MRRFMLLLVATALFGASVNGQSVRTESTFYKTVILTAYASEVIAVNAEAKGFTLSKIIPGDATQCHAVGRDRDFTITGAANLQQFSMYQGSGQATIHVTYFRQAGK